MNSACTVDILDRGPTSEAQATGFWRESYERYPEKTFGLSRMAKVAGLAFSVAVSAVTAMPDPWLLEGRRRDAVVTMSIYQEAIVRFISLQEARQLALQLMAEIETARLDTAKREARRALELEDIV